MRSHRIKRPAYAVAFLITQVCVGLHAQQALPTSTAYAPYPARKGMVVSSHYLASQAGVEVLKGGGNAVDAAIATGMTLAVVHPAAGNIGGGGFMVIYWKTGVVTAFDFRERAPARAHDRMYLDAEGRYVDDLNHEGYLSVGVPGTVAGFDLALKKFGTKSWKQLTEPAERLAEKGFPLSWSMAEDFKDLAGDWTKYPASAKVFLKGDSVFYEPGEVWKQPDLAKSLRRIQKNGRDGFYKGETARLLAADMKAHGGLITEDDLASYEATERAPVRGTYRGYEIISMSPPSSGGVAVVEMLNILEGFNLTSYGHNSAAHLHLLVEAMRRAFADRARYLGDPDFNPDLPVAMLTSKEHAAELRKTISLNTASKSPLQEVQIPQESEHTTHYSVVDKDGNCVIVTYTLEYGYGSRIVADGAGFLLNNEMGDFNPVPGRTDSTGMIGTAPNIVRPGKRMLSSMTPTIIAKNGKPWALIGSPGGRTIINTVLQVAVNLIDFHMNVAEAVSSKRIHHQWQPDVVRLEVNTTSRDSERLLEMMGHRLRRGGYQGQVMAIVINDSTGVRWGASDPRDADAAAVGY